MERKGSGFKKILDDYEFQPTYNDELVPVFRSEYDAFFLTLKNLNYHQGGELGGNRGGENDVNWDERSEIIIKCMKIEPSISVARITKETGLTRRQV